MAGIGIAKDTLEPLIGAPVDPQVYKQISDFVEKYDGILGSHNLIYIITDQEGAWHPFMRRSRMM